MSTAVEPATDEDGTRRKPAGAVRAVVGLLLVGGMLVGCGPAQLTADSSCAEYLKRPQQERYDTALRLSVELQAKNAGNPMWGLNLDYNCGQSPGRKISQAFGL